MLCLLERGIEYKLVDIKVVVTICLGLELTVMLSFMTRHSKEVYGYNQLIHNREGARQLAFLQSLHP